MEARAARLVGSPCYLAPEQVASSGAAGPASDQYALGVIAYECLTGQRPFDGDSLDAVLQAIAAGAPRPPRALQPAAPRRARGRRPAGHEPRAVAAIRLGDRPWACPVAVCGAAKTAGASGDDHRPRGLIGHRAAPGAGSGVPTSPAIQVEAATRSPFVRTLPPEDPDMAAVSDELSYPAGGDRAAGGARTTMPPCCP